MAGTDHWALEIKFPFSCDNNPLYLNSLFVCTLAQSKACIAQTKNNSCCKLMDHSYSPFVLVSVKHWFPSHHTVIVCRDIYFFSLSKCSMSVDGKNNAISVNTPHACIPNVTMCTLHGVATGLLCQPARLCNQHHEDMTLLNKLSYDVWKYYMYFCMNIRLEALYYYYDIHVGFIVIDDICVMYARKLNEVG